MSMNNDEPKEEREVCIIYSESFSGTDTKQTVCHVYLPAEWELETD